MRVEIARRLRWDQRNDSIGTMKLLDPNDPFFRPVWRRWATVMVPVAWAGLELVNGSPGWALVFGAAGGYAFWMLIVNAPSDTE